jgi:predicted  nucleic acid-binding Zn-ribbon protein
MLFFLLVFFKESLEEERRMKARAQGEVERCMESWKALEQQWNDERKKFEEEKRQLQDNGSADESRLRRMQEELDAYKTMLDAKEREFVDMQVLEKKIFFQYF